MNTSRGLDNVAATTWQDKPTAYVRTAGSIEEKFEFNDFDYVLHLRGLQLVYK